MMKALYRILLITLFFSTQVFGQIYNPVSWETSVERTSEKEYELVIAASIDDGWHLYSLNVPEGGPIPTSVYFKPLDDQYKLVESVTEGEGHEEFDKVFEMEIKYFENKAFFRQKVETLEATELSIDATVEFMACDDSSCLPPTEVDLSFKLDPESPLTEKDKDPIQIEANSFLQKTAADQAKADKTDTNSENVASKKGGDPTKKKGLWTLFILSFFAGFAALLTPCVFPMIPMTVSFFTKQSKTKAIGIRNAVVYGISIVLLYVLLGTVVTSFFGADSLNALSTNIWFNLAFFLLLIVFAISFLGAFEITLPSSWSTKVDSQADRGGIIGIFFMALALAIVSFSCTGPIVGTALVAAAAQGGIAPVVSMLGFSLAIALPFSVFAAFPGWLNSLPKSGGWLNTVKVFLGFLELALAFKFLSNADLVLQAHWLEREVFIAIWITIFGALAFYLFGKIKLPHDSDLTHLSVGRLSLGLIVMAFTIYMVPGLWGAPLKLISGFPPPMHYSESPHGVGYFKLSDSGSHTPKVIPEGAHLGPHDILAFLDYEKGLAYAKKVNKPIMIDFTGHACVNCRKMEERVWSDPRVLQILKNDLVLISLYVDDKRELLENERYTSEIDGKEVTTIGKKWSEFQIHKYKANAQPYYVLIGHDEKNLNEYSAYNPDIEDYLAWLKEGLSQFK